MCQINKTLLALCILGIMGCTSNPSNTSTEAFEEELEKINQEWDLNAEEGNQPENSKFYTDDAVRVAMGMMLTGKSEIQKSFDDTPKKMKILQNDNQLESVWVSGDLAVAHGTYSGVWVSTSGDEYKNYAKAAGVSVYERQNDKSWKMVLTVFDDLNNHLLEASNKYHELNPDNMDEILTQDFVGHGYGEGGVNNWDLEGHKKYWSNNRGIAKDVIHQQLAEGSWVATWFTRTGMMNGEEMKADIMQFKRFEGEKIAELWEYFTLEEEEE